MEPMAGILPCIFPMLYILLGTTTVLPAIVYEAYIDPKIVKRRIGPSLARSELWIKLEEIVL